MIEQFFIAVFGLSAVALMARGRAPYTFWGCVFGFAAEPFWFYSALKAHQWGVMLLVFVYASVYAIGIYAHRPRRKA